MVISRSMTRKRRVQEAIPVTAGVKLIASIGDSQQRTLIKVHSWRGEPRVLAG
jgi:hypothetical protein